MKVITGDECGFLKESVGNSSAWKSRILHSEAASRAKGCVGLCWTAADTTPESTHKQLASLTFNGIVNLYQPTTNAKTSSFTKYRKDLSIPLEFDCTSSTTPSTTATATHFTKCIGMQALHENKLVIANQQGQVNVVNLASSQSSKPQQHSFSTLTPQQLQESLSSSMVQAPITTMAVQPSEATIALAGPSRECCLYDLQTQRLVWKSKNLPPHGQTLLQPQVWPTAIVFPKKNDGKTMIVGNAYHQLRIYDIRAQRRRPILYTDDIQSTSNNSSDNSLFSHKITSICETNLHEIAVATAAGDILSMDLRKWSSNDATTSVLGRYIGPCGSVTAMDARENCKLAVVGLDRTLRIYDTTTRKEIASLYLKQRLRQVLWDYDGSMNDDNDEDGNGMVLDSDNIYEQEDRVQEYVDSEEEPDDVSDADGSNESDGLQRETDQEESEEEDSVSSSSSSSSTDDNQDDTSEEDDRDSLIPSQKRRKR